MKNSHGYDKILTEILKISTPYILSLLTYICNRVLSAEVFPSRLKYWEIKPLFKKVDKMSMYNYRPISLLTSFSKIIAKIIYKRLYHHININNILVKEQWWSVL
jgi:Notch-like protein